MKNPVMFTVEIGTVIMIVITIISLSAEVVSPPMAVRLYTI